MSNTVATGRIDFRPLWFVAPLSAMAYPVTLIAFHKAVGMLEAGGGGIALAGAVLSLLAAFAAPATALACAILLFRKGIPSTAELRARRVTLLAVAAPPMFTAIGDDMFMLGNPVPDVWLFAAFWAAMIAWIAHAGRDARTRPVADIGFARTRVAHGVTATLLLVFLFPHLINHLAGTVGPDAHRSLMGVLRHFYRNPVVEPALVAGFLFMVVSGARMAWVHSAREADRFRVLQLASGAFLLVFVTNHFNGVMILARAYLGIDSDWAFASGAPIGLIKDSWNIRLIPDYALAVVFVLAHLASGLRKVMLAHGARKEVADGIVVWGTALSLLVSSAIVLGLCGLRFSFQQETGSGVSKGAALAPVSPKVAVALSRSAIARPKTRLPEIARKEAAGMRLLR